MVGRAAINADIIDIREEQTRLDPPTVFGTTRIEARHSVTRVPKITRTPIGIGASGLELGLQSGVSVVIYAIGTAQTPVRHQNILIVAGIHNPPDGQLPLIGQASDDLRILPGPGQPGQQGDGQNGNTGHNHHQLNQCETGSLPVDIINGLEPAWKPAMKSVCVHGVCPGLCFSTQFATTR